MAQARARVLADCLVQAREPVAKRRPIIVQKYGGSSVADVEKIGTRRRPRRRREARGQRRRRRRQRDGQDHRRAPRARAPGRGARRRPARSRRGASSTCCSRPASACRWRCSRSRSRRAGYDAISFTGIAVGHPHERSPLRRAHHRGAPAPHRGRARARQDRDRRRLPGHELQARDHDARSRRLRHDRRRARRGARAPSAARSTATSTASTPPIRASSPTPQHLPELDHAMLAGDGRVRREGRSTRRPSSGRAAPASPSTRARPSTPTDGAREQTVVRKFAPERGADARARSSAEGNVVLARARRSGAARRAARARRRGEGRRSRTSRSARRGATRS